MRRDPAGPQRGHRPRRAAALVLAAVASVASLASIGLAGCSSAAASGDGYVSGDGTVTTYQVADRKPAPALSGTTLQGQRLALSSYRGAVVVLNFWGSWCAPCRLEGPFLANMSTDDAAKGVRFVGINVRDDAASARAYLQNIGSTYPSFFDAPDGRLVLAFSTIVPPQATPSTLVIDRQGRIAVRIIGPTTQPRLAAILAPLVSELP